MIAQIQGSHFGMGLALVGLGALGCHSAPQEGAEKAAPIAAAAADVALLRVEQQNVAQWTAVTGTLIAETRTQLSANAAGRVTTTHVERGQSVAEGDILVTLDARAAKHGAIEARANLRNLQAQRTTSTRDCERYEALHKKQAISDQEHQRMMAQCRELDAQFEAAEARAAEAARTLSDGTVRAPFAGVVSERSVQVGDYVQPSSPVVTLLKPDPLRLRCAVPESQAAFVQTGHKVAFEVAAYPGRHFDAEVKFVSGEVREASRDIVFEASATNESHALLPGMFVTGRLFAAAHPACAVPLSSIVTEGDRSFVFRADKGRLVKHVVRVGDVLDLPAGEHGPRIAIEEGLAAGDQVAATISASLHDGQPLARQD